MTDPIRRRKLVLLLPEDDDETTHAWRVKAIVDAINDASVSFSSFYVAGA